MGLGQTAAADHYVGPLPGDFQHHWLLETGFVLPRKGAVTKLLRRLPMSRARRDADIAQAPDRTVMRDDIHPRISARGGNILMVGVQPYTMPYVVALEAGGGTCWTLDCDARVEPFGAPGRHATGCISQVADLIPGVRFRTILMSGVLGFGVNRLSHQLAVARSCAETLEPDGMLVLGWNDRRVSSVFFDEITVRWFDYRPFGGLPPRQRVTGYDHNFAFLQLKPAAAHSQQAPGSY